VTTVPIDGSMVKLGRVRGRYYRENYAQGGVDLVQIIPELVTNADAAISAGGRETGRIVLGFGAPDPGFVERWSERLAPLRSPALLSWRHELRCSDDGEGVDAELVDQRLGALGVAPPKRGQRGLFGRGLRDVWLAQGAGRIEGVRDGRVVESWFFPAPGDDPYAYTHVRDEPANAEDLARLGVTVSGTRVTVPLADPSLPTPGRLRALVSQLVQLRPILEDPARELYLDLPGQPLELLSYPAPQADPERPVLCDKDVEISAGVSAHITVRRSAEPLSAGFSRATRRNGLTIRSGRAAHETTLAGCEGRPGARHLYGEVTCDAIERLQRNALNAPRPELVVKVDRSGLNEHHPTVKKLYAAIDSVLKPIVADEERRAGASRLGTARAVSARDQVGLRALNDALKAAFDHPGASGADPGTAPAEHAPDSGDADAEPDDEVDETPEPDDRDDETAADPPSPESAEEDAPVLGPAVYFKQSPVRLHPGERRTVTILADPGQVPPGTPISLNADTGLNLTLRSGAVPEPGARGLSAVSGTLRARVTVSPGARPTITATAGEHSGELEVIIVRHRASGWVREIARKDEDQLIEADFDPETGVVTVYEGRKEFRELERAARRAGYTKKRVAEYVPYRMLEVEAAANAVYTWAAHQILASRLPEERPSDPAEYAQAIHHEQQALRHRAHHKLMQAFLEPEIFEGAVTLIRATPRRFGPQLELTASED
jgi:hypothetical protein